MRVLVDTNVLFSALLFPESKPADALMRVLNSHELVLCEQNIIELQTIVQRKAPKYRAGVETFLQQLSYEKLPVANQEKSCMRDTADQPILDAAIDGQVDVILTGDKDFLSLDLDRPKCMTAAEFLLEQ